MSEKRNKPTLLTQSEAGLALCLLSGLDSSDSAYIASQLLESDISDERVQSLYHVWLEVFNRQGIVRRDDIHAEALSTPLIDELDSLEEWAKNTSMGEVSLYSPKSIVKVLVTLSSRRDLVNAMNDAASQASKLSGATLEEIADRLESTASRILARQAGKNAVPLSTFSSSLLTHLQDTGEVEPVIPTPFPTLNKLMNGGLRPGELCVIAARPGVGKTTLALNIGLDTAIESDKVVYFKSLEMTGDEIVHKAVACRSLVPLSYLKRRPHLRDVNYEKAIECINEINQMGENFIIDDSAENHLSAVTSQVRSLKAQHGKRLGLVIIDYVQLMTSGSRFARHEDISDITRGLKLLAKDVGVPIIVLSQLNRESEKDKKNNRPRLDNLRSSGSIEQDANQVLLLWKKNEDNSELDDFMSHRFFACLDKNRGGETGMFELAPLLHVSLFHELDTAEE